MRGRWPDGPEYIDKLEGSMETKERLKAILDTLYGQARVLEVCAQQDISETRFHQLRESAIQAAVTAIEPRPAGRPRRGASKSQRIQDLEKRVRELEQALHEAQVREEIALILPQQRTAGATATTSVEKKTRRRRVKIRKSR